MFLHSPYPLAPGCFQVFDLCLPFCNFHIAPTCLWYFFLFSAPFISQSFNFRTPCFTLREFLERGSCPREVACYLKDLEKWYLKSPSFFEWFFLTSFYTVLIPMNSLPTRVLHSVTRTHCFSNLAGLCTLITHGIWKPCSQGYREGALPAVSGLVPWMCKYPDSRRTSYTFFCMKG